MRDQCHLVRLALTCAWFVILEPNSSVFTVEGQIQHKVQFINEFIPEDVEIVLIGHSVGAHVILEIMERISSKRVKQGL